MRTFHYFILFFLFCSFSESNYKIEHTIFDKNVASFKNYVALYNMVIYIEKESGINIPEHMNIKYIKYIYDTSNELDIPINISFRLIFKESTFRYDAKSHRGAYGFMQLMPITELYLINKFKIDLLYFSDYNMLNIFLGLNYLKYHFDYWMNITNSENQSWALALASYNAGKGAVKRYNDIPPFNETINYVNFILNKSHTKI